MMECVAAERLEILKVAVVTAAAVPSVPCPRLVDPSKKVTMPLGFPPNVPPGPFTLTVAVKVTDCPNEDGLDEELTTVLVPALLTVCPPDRVPLLGEKLLSSL